MHNFAKLLLPFVMAGALGAEEPCGWVGPHVASIQTTKHTTALDVVNVVRAAIEDDHDSHLALRIAVSAEELAKKPMLGLWVKDIPAVVVLNYVAEQCFMRLTFTDGVWVLSDPPILEREYSDDIITHTMPLLTKDELNALGLHRVEGRIVVKEGPKWPSEEFGRIHTIVGGKHIVMAKRREIENLKALLLLHRRGYKVPTINSEQDGADQPAIAPESKPEGDQEPKPESEGRSQ